VTESTPTPNNMPGAEPKAEAPKVEAPKAEAVPPAVNDAAADDAAELARLRKIHADESKWEKRAKQNFEDAEKLRELMKTLGGEKSTEFDPKAAFDALNAKLEAAETARVRAEIARTEKVDPEFIHGTSEEDMRASAQRYREAVNAAIEEALKAKNVPAAPPASTVTANGKITGADQITSRDQLAKLSPAERLKAYQEGRLDGLMGKSA
jgi:hypothetical protein